MSCGGVEQFCMQLSFGAMLHSTKVGAWFSSSVYSVVEVFDIKKTILNVKNEIHWSFCIKLSLS